MLYSSQARVSKGVWYTCSEPRVSLETERDKKAHALQRKVWDKAFTSQGRETAAPIFCIANEFHLALSDYEPRVSYYTTQLLGVIDSKIGQPMDVTRWLNYYSFDVMGDLAFGKGFNMLAEGQDQYFFAHLRGHMKAIGLTSHLTWLFPFLKRIPGINTEYRKHMKWLEDQVDQRMKVRSLTQPPSKTQI